MQVSSSRRPRRSPEDLKARILAAAREEFVKGGLRGATTAAIARRADVTEAQLFRYYASKAELFREAVFLPLATHIADFEPDAFSGPIEAESYRAGAELYIGQLARFLEGNDKLLLALLIAQAQGGDEAAGLDPIDSLGAYFARGAGMMRRRTGDDAKVDPAIMVRVSFAALLGITLFRDALFPDGMASAEAIEAGTIDFLIEGINANWDSPKKDEDR